MVLFIFALPLGGKMRLTTLHLASIFELNTASEFSKKRDQIGDHQKSRRIFRF